jgi:hypothetical protein
MDGCTIYDHTPGIIQCIGKLAPQTGFVCAGNLRVTMKPGSGTSPPRAVPLSGKEYLDKAEQFQVGTRIPGDDTNPHGVLFSGIHQSVETGKAADGSSTYTLIISVSFNDFRMTKSTGFRRCETNGKPLYVSGHVYVRVPD